MSSKVIRNLAVVVFTGLLVAAGVLSGAAGTLDGPAGAGSGDCSACHEKQVKSMKDGAMHASVHTQAGIEKCVDCHDSEALKKTHAGVKPGEKKFVKPRRYSREFCLKCHGTAADLAKRTAKSKVLTDNKGTVVNPHDIPKTEKHAGADQCSNCHKEHKKNPDALRYCTGCHHAGEFACSKCHS